MKKTLTAIIIGLLCFSMFPILAPRTEAETSKWIVKTPLPRPQALFGTAVANGRIFAIGGQYQSGGPTPAWSDSNYEYDPLIDSWSSKAAMPTKRTTLAAISMNNKIYAIGGAASTSGGAYSVNEEFDPISNSWTTRAPMPTPRNWISAAAVNGKIYVIGGSDNSGGIFSMNEMYDPLTDTWTTKKPDPQARLACGIAVVNGKIYLIGGWVRPGAPPGEPTTLTEEYDPQTDTWTTKAPMPTARNGLAVTVMNNRIYAVGGATDFNPWTNNLNVVEEYDPTTDTWTAGQSMPTPRSLLGVAVAGNKIYAIGGWGSTGYLDTNEEFSIGALVGACALDFDPDCLNLRSKGRWVTAYIELPEGYYVADIDVSSIKLNDTIAVDPAAPTTIEDYDSDGIPDLMIKFDRADVQQYILDSVLIESKFMTAALTVTGRLNDGTMFQGTDTIKITMPGNYWKIIYLDKLGIA